jgi:A/G-specific adenine glycosylase
LNGDEAQRLDLLATWVRVLSLRTRLLAWYDREKRDLPWRATRDPYHVLVSELMLQQTRVDVVLPYFERWIVRWPSITDVAAATEDEVLAAWSGLGYYRRARSLLAAARAVVSEHGGVVPSDVAELRALPGVGPYTASAVASIAYDVVTPVVDGNVERVLSRLLADRREPCAARKRTLAEAARRLVTGLVGEDPQAMEPPEGLRPSDWNQAMMELGAVVCTPGEPQCPLCPWRRSCIGFRAGLAPELPRRKPKKPSRNVNLRMAVVRRDEHVLLVQRAEGTLLSGMWELPTTDEDGTVADLSALVGAALGVDLALPAEPSRDFRHSITTRRITVYVHELDLSAVAGTADDHPGVAWARPQDLRDFGLSSMTRKALAT